MLDYESLSSRESALRNKSVSRLKKMVSDSLQHLRDPKLGMVSISDLVLSRDLRHAKVFVRVVGCDSKQAALPSIRVLNRAKGHVRHTLGASKQLSVVPTLTFIFDDTVENANRMEFLLHTESQNGQGSSDPETE